jgi:hypothetical protein
LKSSPKPRAKPARGRSLKVRGSRWKIRWVNNLADNFGICDYEKKEIRIEKGQQLATELDTVVHEILHAALPDLSEASVYDTANSIAEALVKLGYIRKD